MRHSYLSLPVYSSRCYLDSLKFWCFFCFCFLDTTVKAMEEAVVVSQCEIKDPKSILHSVSACITLCNQSYGWRNNSITVSMSPYHGEIKQSIGQRVLKFFKLYQPKPRMDHCWCWGLIREVTSPSSSQKPTTGLLRAWLHCHLPSFVKVGKCLL